MGDLKGTAFEGSILAINMQEEDETFCQSKKPVLDPEEKTLTSTTAERIVSKYLLISCFNCGKLTPIVFYFQHQIGEEQMLLNLKGEMQLVI